MSGAPPDLKESGNVGKVWRKIDELDHKIDRLCTDVAFIKGKLEGAQIVEEKKFSIRSGMFIAAISAGMAAITAFFIR